MVTHKNLTSPQSPSHNTHLALQSLSHLQVSRLHHKVAPCWLQQGQSKAKTGQDCPRPHKAAKLPRRSCWVISALLRLCSSSSDSQQLRCVQTTRRSRSDQLPRLHLGMAAHHPDVEQTPTTHSPRGQTSHALIGVCRGFKGNNTAHQVTATLCGSAQITTIILTQTNLMMVYTSTCSDKQQTLRPKQKHQSRDHMLRLQQPPTHNTHMQPVAPNLLQPCRAGRAACP